MNSMNGRKPWRVQDGRYEHLISCENTECLKHETSFHNPGNMNPNEILNVILDECFAFVEKVRR